MKVSDSRNFRTLSKLSVSYARHKTQKTLLISLIGYSYCPTIYSYWTFRQENTVPFQYPIFLTQASTKTSQVEQNWEEWNECNLYFFCKILCLFINLVPSASFYYKRKALKIGGGYKRGLQKSQFPKCKSTT